MTESRTKKVIRNTGTGITSRLILILLDFIVKTIFIKLLGEQYAGVSGLFTSILSALSLAELGIGSAIAFALYKPIAEKDYLYIAKYMNFYKKAYRLVAAFIFVVGMALIPFLGVLVKDVPDIKESITLIYVIYIFNSAVSYLLIYKSVLLTANQNSYKMALIDIVMNIVKSVAQCLILLLTREFLAYLIIGVSFTIIRNVIVSVVANKDFKELKQYAGEKLSKEERKRILKDVGALSMYTALSAVLHGTDDIIISAMLGTSLVGILYYYKMLKKSITMLLNQFFNAVTPSVGNLAVEGSGEAQYKVFRKYNFTVFWVTCFCSTSFTVLYIPFVRDIWLGERFVLSMSIVLALVLEFFMANMTSVFSSFRNANGLFVQGKWRPAVMAVINIALSIILAKPWGMFGVLIATCISRATTQLWYDPWLVYRRVFNRSVKEYFLKYAEFLLVTAGSTAITYFIGNTFSFNNVYINFIYLCVLCVVIPNGIMFIGYRKTNDFAELKKTILRFVKRRGNGNH